MCRGLTATVQCFVTQSTSKSTSKRRPLSNLYDQHSSISAHPETASNLSINDTQPLQPALERHPETAFSATSTHLVQKRPPTSPRTPRSGSEQATSFAYSHLQNRLRPLSLKKILSTDHIGHMYTVVLYCTLRATDARSRAYY